jgi:MFS family permease
VLHFASAAVRHRAVNGSSGDRTIPQVIAFYPDGRHNAPAFFYGWVIVAVAFVTMGIGFRTAFPLLFPPILDEFGWERGVTAEAFSFGFLVSAGLSPLLGRLMDHRGPRLVIEMGVGFTRVLALARSHCCPRVQALIQQGGWRSACWTMGEGAHRRVGPPQPFIA